MNASSVFARLTAAAKTTLLIAGGGLLIVLSALAGYFNGTSSEFASSADPYVRTGTFAGPAQPLGAGTAHAFVTLEAGTPGGPRCARHRSRAGYATGPW